MALACHSSAGLHDLREVPLTPWPSRARCASVTTGFTFDHRDLSRWAEDNTVTSTLTGCWQALRAASTQFRDYHWATSDSARDEQVLTSMRTTGTLSAGWLPSTWSLVCADDTGGPLDGEWALVLETGPGQSGPTKLMLVDHWKLVEEDKPAKRWRQPAATWLPHADSSHPRDAGSQPGWGQVWGDAGTWRAFQEGSALDTPARVLARLHTGPGLTLTPWEMFLDQLTCQSRGACPGVGTVLLNPDGDVNEHSFGVVVGRDLIRTWSVRDNGWRTEHWDDRPKLQPLDPRPLLSPAQLLTIGYPESTRRGRQDLFTGVRAYKLPGEKELAQEVAKTVAPIIWRDKVKDVAKERELVEALTGAEGMFTFYKRHIDAGDPLFGHAEFAVIDKFIAMSLPTGATAAVFAPGPKIHSGQEPLRVDLTKLVVGPAKAEFPDDLANGWRFYADGVEGLHIMPLVGENRGRVSRADRDAILASTDRFAAGLSDGVIEHPGEAEDAAAEELLQAIQAGARRLAAALAQHGYKTDDAVRAVSAKELERIERLYRDRSWTRSSAAVIANAGDPLTAPGDIPAPPPDPAYGPTEPTEPVEPTEPAVVADGRVAALRFNEPLGGAADDAARRTAEPQAVRDFHADIDMVIRRCWETTAAYSPSRPIPPHPSNTLTPAEWSTDLDKVRKLDNDLSPGDDTYYNAVWAATRAITIQRGMKFTLPADAQWHSAFAVTSTRGWWREPARGWRTGDVLGLADPTVKDGYHWAVALGSGSPGSAACEVLISLSEDFETRYRLMPLPGSSQVRQVWSPAPRSPFAPDHPFGAFYGPTLARMRSVVEAVSWLGGTNMAGSSDLVQALTDRTPVKATTGAELVARVARELRPILPDALAHAVTEAAQRTGLRPPVTTPAPPLWPGAVVFGERKEDVGIVLTDGSVLGQCSRVVDGVGTYSVNDFAPRWVWYPDLAAFDHH